MSRFKHFPETLTIPRWGLWPLGLLLLCMAGARADATTVAGVRLFSAPDHTRVVLDLDGPATYTIRRVEGPERLAIDVAGAGLKAIQPIAVDDGLLLRVRRNRLRTKAQVVLDLVEQAPFRHFMLPAADGRPHRIVVDVFRPAEIAVPAEDPVFVRPPPRLVQERPLRVIIDPGHGGLDPGALRGSIQEKDIVLDVCLRMRDILKALPGYEPILTRDRDWYPSLADRVTSAGKQQGDLFISVHCNTHRRSSVRGMEVYFLSLQGASDRESQELADKENAADMVGLAPEHTASDAVLSILMDLHMTQVLKQSSRLSETILTTCESRGLATRRVKQARFQVLRSLAMPSALVELAYLTNPDDRRLLTNADGRQMLAEAVVAGILDYHQDGTILAVGPTEPNWSRHYKVRRGDNLWRLAQQHGTTVAEIRQRNNLQDDRISAGQYLSLPEGRPES